MTLFRLTTLHAEVAAADIPVQKCSHVYIKPYGVCALHTAAIFGVTAHSTWSNICSTSLCLLVPDDAEIPRRNCIGKYLRSSSRVILVEDTGGVEGLLLGITQPWHSPCCRPCWVVCKDVMASDILRSTISSHQLPVTALWRCVDPYCSSLFFKDVTASDVLRGANSSN